MWTLYGQNILSNDIAERQTVFALIRFSSAMIEFKFNTHTLLQ